jgi:hypothetical protein
MAGPGFGGTVAGSLGWGRWGSGVTGVTGSTGSGMTIGAGTGEPGGGGT